LGQAKKKAGKRTAAEMASYGISPEPDGPEWNRSRSLFQEEGKTTMMKPSTQDRTEGKLHEVKGKIKEEAGKVTNDKDLEVSGKAEKTAGKAQEWIGRAEKAVGE
jgi:uncharacterized protein YjbJ (UPF0337 family)